jgi:hypothetical protein
MSGGKGGSQTTKVEIPKWLENAAQSNIARGEYASTLGPIAYYGPDVAALTPMQEAAMANTGQAASAFGTAGGGLSPSAGMPAANTYAGGLRGYSSGDIYDQALSELQARAPGQYDAIRAMFINPATGAPPLRGFPTPAPAPLPAAVRAYTNEPGGNYGGAGPSGAVGMGGYGFGDAMNDISVGFGGKGFGAGANGFWG